MGALTDNRKRFPDFSPSTPPSKKPKLPSQQSIRKGAAAIPRFPPPEPLRRLVHGPQRIIKAFGIGSTNSTRRSTESTGNFVSRIRDRKRFGSVSEVEEGSDKELGLEEYRRLVVEVEDEVRSPSVELLPAKEEGDRSRELEDEIQSVEKKDIPLYKELYESSLKKHSSILGDLEFEVKLTEKKLLGFRLADEVLKKKSKEDPHQLFAPLTDEDEDDINRAMKSAGRREVLVTHKASNIEITGEVLRCLSRCAWLNDEVINLYLELLKEREKREPKRFLKCHFFNTFFYKRLISGGKGYDFKAVKRWTTQRKIGYELVECEKIFVPIHKEVHWCLAIINMKDKKLQYLDSLGGMDKSVLRVLAKYLMDEAKDKSGKQIDAMSWSQETIRNLPLQENGYDCGMFMLKYIDCQSRGLNLTFGQEHMPYFRKRTVMEILRLRAE